MPITPSSPTSDDKPFRMSELPEEELADYRDRSYASGGRLGSLTTDASRRNRFFGGICLALPLSALLWLLFYFLLNGLLP